MLPSRGGVVACLCLMATACSLFTDLGGFSDAPPSGTSSPDGGGSGSNDATSPSPVLDAGGGDVADAPTTSASCLPDNNTFCESFDIAAQVPSGWQPFTKLGEVAIEARADAPSPTNVLRVTTPGVQSNPGFAYLHRDFLLSPEEVTLEEDMFIDAPTSQYQNLSTIDLRKDGHLYSVQLSREGNDTLIEELVKAAGGNQDSLPSATTVMPTGKWVRVGISLSRSAKTYTVTIDGKPVITKPTRTDSFALANGGELSVGIGLSYVPKAPSLAVAIDNVKVTWK